MSRFPILAAYDRTHGPAPGSAGDGIHPGSVYTGTISKTPEGGEVEVTINDLSTEFDYRCRISSGLGVTVGQEVCVIFDSQKIPWVVTGELPTSVVSRSGEPADRSRPRWQSSSGKVIFSPPLVLDARDFGVKADNASDDTAALQAALDQAKAEVATVDAASGTGFAARVELPLGYTKVKGVTIASNVHLDGQGDKSILILAGASNKNLIQSESWGTATGLDRGIKIGMGKGLRLIGNKANQTIVPVQSFVTADTEVSTAPSTLPVVDTTGLAASGLVWVGPLQLAYTGKTGTSLTGVTISYGSDTARAMSWVTPVNGQGHLVAIQGTACHIFAYGEMAAANGIIFQGPDPLASGGVIAPNNRVGKGTRISGCNGYGLEIGENVSDGFIEEGVELGAANIRGALLVRSADWKFSNLHPVGTFGNKINAIPQAILIAASDFTGDGIYFDTWPGTTIVFDTSVRGWTTIKGCDLGKLRYFQCSWGVGGGGHGVLFRGVKSHGTVKRPRFAGANMASPIGIGYMNSPWSRTVGVQNFAEPAGGKIQVLNAMDFAPSSAIGGPVISGADTLSYTGRQMNFTKLTADAAIAATSITVGDTTGFDASGTITLLAEENESYTPMQITYTGKTGTTFTGIPAEGPGSITAAASAAGQRGQIAQHFFTGVSGGVTVSKPNGSSVECQAQSPLVTEMVVSDPVFAGFRTQRFLMTPSDDWQVHGGVSGGKKMRSNGTLSVGAGTLTAKTAHKLAEEPTSVNLTPTADTQGRRYWVTVSSSEITVTLDANATTKPITFNWTAEITT